DVAHALRDAAPAAARCIASPLFTENENLLRLRQATARQRSSAMLSAVQAHLKAMRCCVQSGCIQQRQQVL
ncbi:hypothetical protein, partial [Xanthomonas perforans]|uniref:hypothetical protein n=1 Tax=Xanthomonas perforans TaxID=442694 RepID=UPI0019CF9DD9